MTQKATASILDAVLQGQRLSDAEARSLADWADLPPLLATATQLRDHVHQNRISYSRKVFIPLTQLCRDVCHYCTFAQPPRPGQKAYLTGAEILAIAQAGAQAGCHEALFTLGDKPERRYKVAARELAELGHDTTISYVAEMAELVLKETGLLPHMNPGVMTAEEIALLKRVSVSQGMMLENVSPRLSERGDVHFGSPDKRPEVRLEMIRLAGQLKVPFTSGILIGIGETRLERIESLLALRALHQQYDHIQEIIIQNFRAKPDTKMANAPEPDLDDLLWTLAIARVIFGGAMNIQAPPNLSPGVYQQLVSAGLNDWGGVSPVTPDHVNPEARWPHLQELADRTAETGKVLVERLAVYPSYTRDMLQWQDQRLLTPLLQSSDSEGYARTGDWSPGVQAEIPAAELALMMQAQGKALEHVSVDVEVIIEKALAAEPVSEAEIVRLFQARGSDFAAVCHAADTLRQRVNGDVVSYTVNRNINLVNDPKSEQLLPKRTSFCPEE